MTTPGGWPPSETRPPHAPGQVGPHAGPAARAGFHTRPPQARDHRARTLGIVALVVGGVALLAQLMMVILPRLLRIPLVLGGGGLWGDEGWAEGLLPSTTSAYVGGVTLDSGRSVSGEALVGLRCRTHGDRTGALDSTPSSLRCDDVARVTPETSVLCRAADGDEWYAVVRFTDGSGFLVVTVLTDYDDPLVTSAVVTARTASSGVARLDER